MVIPGRVQHGVVVLAGNAPLPEGADVSVLFPPSSNPKPPVEGKRIEVPLVRTGQPDSVRLTGSNITEILDEEDASPRH